MKLLLTGFEPFGGQAVNPSWQAVSCLPDRIAGAQVEKLLIPTTFAGSVPCLRRAIEQLRPQAVLCLGVAGGRAAITPERVALNVDDARIPDNDGAQPVDRPIVAGGPAAYFATLPVKAMVRAIRAAGLPAELSNSAGTFVCNHLMYGLLHLLAQEHPGVRGGFMHVPCLPGQGEPCLSLEDTVRGVEAAVAAVVQQTAAGEVGAPC